MMVTYMLLIYSLYSESRQLLVRGKKLTMMVMMMMTQVKYLDASKNYLYVSVIFRFGKEL